MTRGTEARKGMEEGGVQGAEERYRIKARALYAILRGVVDMHPVACTPVVRRSRSMCVQQLERDHNIVQHIIDDVALLAASLAAATPTTSLTRSNSQTRFLEAVASPLSKGADGVSAVAGAGAVGAGGRLGFIGSECWARLEFLRFFLETSDSHLKLSAAQALCLWKALQESSIETACCWFRLLQDAGGLLHSDASDAIFASLLQLPPRAYTSLHVLDCFLAYFADINAETTAAHKGVRGSAVLQVLGRDGKRPGGRLTGQGLVGRRIAVRSSDDNKMHPATVTGYDPKQWLKHSIVWDAGGDEARKTLHDSSAYAAEWTLIEDNIDIDAAALHLDVCRNLNQLRGFDTLWNVALSAEDDAVAAKAGSIIQKLMLCLECDTDTRDRGKGASGGDSGMDTDAGAAREGDGEGGKLLTLLLAEIDAAARGVFTSEDLAVHELRKRARSLSLEMKGDLDSKERSERGSPGPPLGGAAAGKRGAEPTEPVAVDAAAALSAVAAASGSDSLARPHPLHGKVETAGAEDCKRLKRCLALALGVLGVQRGAESHAALSRSRSAAAEGAAGVGAAAEAKNYIDMSDGAAMQATDSEAILAQEHAQREQDNRLRLGASLTRMAAESEDYYNLLFGIIEAPSSSAEVKLSERLHVPAARAAAGWRLRVDCWRGRVSGGPCVLCRACCG